MYLVNRSSVARVLEQMPNFITLASGHHYWRMAVGLARSLRLQGGDSGIKIGVISDCAESLEGGDVFDAVIPLNDTYGPGVAQKLHLDLYNPFDECIFIDADCLVFGNPEALWLQYRQQPIGILSCQQLTAASQHYAIADVPKYLSSYDVREIPQFSSGVFYFDKSDGTRTFFDCARMIYINRNKVGLLPSRARVASATLEE